MNHQQILNKLAAGDLVESISDDVARLTSRAMTVPKGTPVDYEQVSSSIISHLLLRWNCVLLAQEDTVSLNYKWTTSVALAVVLHKYGFQDQTLTTNALIAIDELNRAVVLSDDFYRKSEEIKLFISDKPTPLLRRPSVKKNITFYRPGDVVSIQIKDHFYAAYVYELEGGHRAPIIELYDFFACKKPTIEDVLRSKAIKGIYKESGTAKRYAVYGMKNVPDLANQLHLIANGVPAGPSDKPLGSSMSFYVSNLFRLVDDIQEMFFQS